MPDLKKFRAKGIVVNTSKRRYHVTPNGMRSMVAYLTLRDKVVLPVLRRIESNKRRPYELKHALMPLKNVIARYN